MSEWSMLFPSTWPRSPLYKWQCLLPEKRHRRPHTCWWEGGRARIVNLGCGALVPPTRGRFIRHHRRKRAQNPTGLSHQGSDWRPPVVSPSSIKESVQTDGSKRASETKQLPSLPCQHTHPQRTLNQCLVLKVAKAHRQAGFPT